MSVTLSVVFLFACFILGVMIGTIYAVSTFHQIMKYYHSFTIKHLENLIYDQHEYTKSLSSLFEKYYRETDMRVTTLELEIRGKHDEQQLSDD